MGAEELPEQLLTSLLYCPALPFSTLNEIPSPYLLLPYHCDRFLVASQALGWKSCTSRLINTGEGLKWMENELERSRQSWKEPGDAAKVRVVLVPSGELSITFATIPPPPLSLLSSPPTPPFPVSNSFIKLHLDTSPTKPSLLTRLKTTSRSHYLDSRCRAGLGADYSKPDEVVLYNSEGLVMEGSIYNLAFWRDGSWITPSEGTGCLPGVMRRYLLERGIWKVGDLRVEDLQDGEAVLCSNAVRGLVLGKIMIKREN